VSAWTGERKWDRVVPEGRFHRAWRRAPSTVERFEEVLLFAHDPREDRWASDAYGPMGWVVACLTPMGLDRTWFSLSELTELLGCDTGSARRCVKRMVSGGDADQKGEGRGRRYRLAVRRQLPSDDYDEVIGDYRNVPDHPWTIDSSSALSAGLWRAFQVVDKTTCSEVGILDTPGRLRLIEAADRRASEWKNYAADWVSQSDWELFLDLEDWVDDQRRHDDHDRPADRPPLPTWTRGASLTKHGWLLPDGTSRPLAAALEDDQTAPPEPESTE